MPPIFNEDEAERDRCNPLITLDEADAIRKFSPLIVSVAAQAQRKCHGVVRTEEVNNAQIQGVTSGYADFSTFSVERGRMMSAVEVDRGQLVAILGWVWPIACSATSIRSRKRSRSPASASASSASASRRGSFFGNSQDNFAVIPLSPISGCSARVSRCR